MKVRISYAAGVAVHNIYLAHAARSQMQAGKMFLPSLAASWDSPLFMLQKVARALKLLGSGGIRVRTRFACQRRNP